MQIDIDKPITSYIEFCDKQNPEKPWFCQPERLEGLETISGTTIYRPILVMNPSGTFNSPVTVSSSLLYSLGSLTGK